MENITLTAKKRILEILKELKIGQNKFEKSCGIPTGTINHGKGDLSSSTLAKIMAAYPKINIEWVIAGTGTMFKSEEQVTPAIDKDVEYLKSIISAQSKTIETQERTISMLERQLQIVGENNSNQPMQTIV